MTPEREAELFAKFDLLLELHRQTQSRLDRIEGAQMEGNARMREIEGAVRELTGRVSEQSASFRSP